MSVESIRFRPLFGVNDWLGPFGDDAELGGADYLEAFATLYCPAPVVRRLIITVLLGIRIPRDGVEVILHGLGVGRGAVLELGVGAEVIGDALLVKVIGNSLIGHQLPVGGLPHDGPVEHVLQKHDAA